MLKIKKEERKEIEMHSSSFTVQKGTLQRSSGAHLWVSYLRQKCPEKSEEDKGPMLSSLVRASSLQPLKILILCLL